MLLQLIFSNKLQTTCLEPPSNNKHETFSALFSYLWHLIRVKIICQTACYSMQKIMAFLKLCFETFCAANVLAA